MKKFKGTKKIIALLLSLSLITGMMPATAFTAYAEAETKTPIDAALFFSDLHCMYKGDSTEGTNGYKKDLVTSMMTTLKNKGPEFSSVTSVGDAFSSNETAYTGKTSVITGYIRNALGNQSIPVNYTWSDHDRAALAKNDKDLIENKSGLIYGAGEDGIYGNKDDDNYYIYAISMSDTSDSERYGQPSTFTEQKLSDFKDDVKALDNKKPLFIASHQPLLARRNDNKLAYKWCEAINEVAETRDVAFFFGHNHNYDDAKDYYYAKNSNMTVQDTNGTKKVDLKFTHMCAGYFDPATTGYAGSSRQGTVMVATIYADEIKYTTYDRNGVYTGGDAVNETVTRDFANAGATGDSSNGRWVTLTEPVPGTEEIPERTTYKYVLDTNGVDPNKGYLIVNTSANGTAYALTNKNGTVDKTEVTISNKEIVVDNETNIKWNFSGSTSGSVGNQGSYLYLARYDDLALNDTVTENTIQNRTNGAYRIYRLSNSRYNYLRYAQNTWNKTSTDKEKNVTSVYLFVYDETITTPGTPEIPDTNGTYAKISGYLTYNSVIGMTAEQAMSFVKAGIDGYTYEGMSEPGADAEVTKLDDNQLDWTWLDTYNPNVAGDYRVEISYNGKSLGTAVVKVPEREVAGITLTNNEREGSVQRGKTHIYGVNLVVNYKDGTSETLPLTTNMLEGKFNNNVNGRYENLTVNYKGHEIADFILNVTDGNDYPEYPDEGAVKVNKTATGVDFQDSGLAQVEVSASGVPIKKGTDVIIMLDTSSSMYKWCVEGDYKNSTEGPDCNHATRDEVLEASLTNLIAFLKTPDEDGGFMDINVAIADFNGYYGDGSGGTSNTPYDRTSGDYVRNGTSTGSGYQQASEAIVYTNGKKDAQGNYTTGSGTLDASAFVPVENLEDSYKLNYTSGTNYDYAFDAIYQLGTAIKNANEEDRDLYVIFMSDGASLQWNYFGTQNTYTKWNDWITGAWSESDLTTTNLNSTTHSYFYDLKDHDGDGQINEHRMANAIKGTGTFEVIRKSTAGLPNGTLTKVEGKEYLYTVPGLGAKLFTINFDARDDGSIKMENIEKALASTASDDTELTQYYYKVQSAEQLGHAFDSIGSEIRYAATNARYVDKMGENFNLQLKTSTYDKKNETTSTVESKTVKPKIEIISYDIYTRDDADNGKIPAGKNIGDRKGTYKILETVTFNAAGTEAYSDLIYTTDANGKKTYTNILDANNIINAKTFFFNNSSSGVAIDGINIPTSTGSTNVLPSETFYWKVGTVQSSEMAMRYYVYLEGSMEGKREAGAYKTNEYAILYYDNYLGHQAQKPTISPTLGWEAANVSYAFYLVNEKGEVVVNQTTGQTGSFANKVAVTTPVVYEEVFLNSSEDIDPMTVAASGVLPEGYEVYDNAAAYTVKVNSNGTGSWQIQTGTGKTQSTYVTNFGGSSQYSNATSMNESDNDYTHTTVWFAVVWKPRTIDDTVVVDYGLPVDINVLGNDMFGDYGKLNAVGEKIPASVSRALYLYSSDFSIDGKPRTSIDTTHGNAKLEGNKIRYQLSDMDIDSKDTFAYEVNYSGTNNPGYYYGEVTVIPATTIYYEDDFVDFGVYDKNTITSPTYVDINKDFSIDIATSDFVTKVLVDSKTAESESGKFTYTMNIPEAGEKTVKVDLFDSKDNLVGTKEFTVMAYDFGTSSEYKGGKGYLSVKVPSYVFANDKISISPEVSNVEDIEVETDIIVTYDGKSINTDSDNEIAIACEKVGSKKLNIEYVNTETKDVIDEIQCTINVVDGGAKTTSSLWNENTDKVWDTKGEALNKTQAEDRPGTYHLPAVDANNLYGYDSAYDEMSTYSMGSARKITVNANRYGIAEFEFWGTGFDVIALTSNDTGTITVQVDNVETSENVKNFIVDTYYGYTKNDADEWVVDNNVKNPLYQVPVIESELGTYGHYKVTIKAAYNKIFDHKVDGTDGKTEYDMYIDAIRIYDPANDGVNDDVVLDAYTKDGEGWPTYVEVRDLLIEKAELDKATTVNGMVLIDGIDATANVTDYKSYGPNNEVYLAKNQSVIFDLEVPSEGAKVKDVQIGLKSADGNTVSYSISGKTGTLKTATGMYYSILDKADKTIVITNTSGGILSVTDVKITYNSDPYATAEAIAPLTMFRVSKATLMSANEILTEDPEIKSVTTDKTKYTVGDTVNVSVKTNDAAEYVTVNGEKITTFTEEGNVRIWTFSQGAEKAENIDFAVVAYNSIGETSKAKQGVVVIETITPEDPDTPDEPGTPEDPDTPVTPEEPDKPVVDEQETPVVASAKIVSVKTDKKTYTQGDKVKVTVTTNSDTTKVKVGTKTLKTFKTTKSNKTWTTTVKASKVGKLSISAVAYNEKGTATKKVIKTVTVKKFAPKKFNVTLNKSKVKKGAKYTVTVKTGTDVKYVKVNGKKITKYTYNKKNATKTFKVTHKASKVGKKTVKVVAYNKAGYASKAKSKTVTVKKK